MMKKRTLFTLYLLFMIALGGWILISDQIILGGTEYKMVKKADLADYPEKDPVTCWIDSFSYRNDLYASLEVSGWAFVETEKDNHQARTDILLVNEKNCYCLEDWSIDKDNIIELRTRQDVKKAYSDKMLPNDLVAVTGKYSAFNIVDGEYDVYVYRWANEDNYGLTKCNIRLEKKGKSLSVLR